MRLYSAEFKTWSQRVFKVVVLSDEHGHVGDLRTAAQAFCGMNLAQIKLSNIKVEKSRHVIDDMAPVKGCFTGNGPWAWVK